MKSITQFIYESSMTEWLKIVEYIRKYKRLPDIIDNLDITEFSHEEQLEIIQLSGIHCFLNKSEYEDGDIVYLITPYDKEELCRYIDDALTNLVTGYNTDDENHYVIKYRGKKPIFTEDGIETPTGKLSKKLPRTNIEWICGNQGLATEGCWYVNDRAKDDMVSYMELIELTPHKPSRIEYGRGIGEFE